MTQQVDINKHPELHPWEAIETTGWCPACGALRLANDDMRLPEIATEPKYLEVPMDSGKGE